VNDYEYDVSRVATTLLRRLGRVCLVIRNRRRYRQPIPRFHASHGAFDSTRVGLKVPEPRHVSHVSRANVVT